MRPAGSSLDLARSQGPCRISSRSIILSADFTFTAASLPKPSRWPPVWARKTSFDPFAGVALGELQRAVRAIAGRLVVDNRTPLMTPREAHSPRPMMASSRPLYSPTRAVTLEVPISTAPMKVGFEPAGAGFGLGGEGTEGRGDGPNPRVSASPVDGADAGTFGTGADHRGSFQRDGDVAAVGEIDALKNRTLHRKLVQRDIKPRDLGVEVARGAQNAIVPPEAV